ncbi:MAG: hypothetical protein HONBIEJF_02139 [Fimbriimonadaceae bacterium]|nr:hypothetical protein [Fimbriimonadaceae bacterium]
MSRGKVVLLSAILLYLAAAFQSGWWNQWVVIGCQVDAFLILTGVLSVRLGSPGAGLSGFLAGVVQGAMAGANLTHYALSRLIAGAATSWVARILGQKSWAVAMASIGIATLLGQILLLFLAAPSNISGYLVETLKTVAINVVIGAGVHGVLNRFWPPLESRD